jgi:hypothetical protein
VRLVQIVPSLARAGGGVGSYAACLARALHECHAVATRFVAATVTADPEPGAELTVAPRQAGGLAASLSRLAAGDPTAVLLHYANYGYARRGCPTWLAQGLGRFRRQQDRVPVVTLFHEVYATGPPWRSSFWLWPLQRRLARQLARLSDAQATSLDLYADLLGRWVDRKRVTVMPVFSTVGEPFEVAPLAEREPRLVVFGGSGARARAFGELRPGLARAVEAVGAEEVLEVGAPPADLPAQVAGRPVRSLGFLPAEAVSALLGRVATGFVAYPPDFLAKSTIFAAYAAHGLVPVSAWRRPAGDGELRRGEHYWTPDGGGPELGTPDFQAIASAAHAWYAGHSLARQAPVFRRLLFG